MCIATEKHIKCVGLLKNTLFLFSQYHLHVGTYLNLAIRKDIFRVYMYITIMTTTST